MNESDLDGMTETEKKNQRGTRKKAQLDLSSKS